jgi:hypothetical protein
LAQTGSPIVIDNCPGVKLTYSDNVSGLTGCNGTGKILRTFTATDSCGNIKTCIQEITVLDSTKPSITCPAKDTVYKSITCTIDTSISSTGSAIIADNCPGVKLSYSDNVSGLTGCNGTGIILRTFTATDSCGNINTCIQEITVLDTIPPSIAGASCPPDTTIDFSVLIIIPDSLGIPKYTDNCTDSTILAATLTYRDDSTGFDNTDPNGNTGTIKRTFFVTDACGNVDSSCMQIITVSGRPPIAEVDHNATLINTPVDGDLSTNDHDPQGLPLTYNTTPVQSPGHGLVTINPDGTYTYTPDPGYIGQDSLRYAVCNTLGLCDTTWAFIDILTIAPGNDPPLALNDYFMTLQDVNVPGTVANNDLDPDWDPLTFTLLISPLHGVLSGPLNSATGAFIYNPDAPFTGIDSFQYMICDDGIPSLCDTAWVYIEISLDLNGSQNDPPVAGNDVNATTINTPVSGSVALNDFDPNGDPLIFTTVGPVIPGLVFNPDGGYTYTPPFNFVGTVSQVYSVCENICMNCLPSDVLCDTATLVIAVMAQGPIAQPDHNGTFINTPVAGDLSTNDIDPGGLPLIYNANTLVGPIHGSVSINPDGTYVYTPDNGFTGVDNFLYKVCNTVGLCDSAWAFIDVIPVTDGNDPPLALNDYFMTFDGIPLNSTVANNDIDPDNDPLTFNPVPVTPPLHGMLVLNTNGTFTYTNNPAFTGRDSFQYQVCDNGLPPLCDSAWAYIDIATYNSNINNPPFAGNDLYLTMLNTPVNGTVASNDFDPDGDVLKFAPEGPLPPGLVLNMDGTFTYNPPNGFVGTINVPYIVCDDGEPTLCDKATLTIIVRFQLTCADGLVCNNKTNISIDCGQKIMPKDLLINPTLPLSFYEVEIRDAQVISCRMILSPEKISVIALRFLLRFHLVVIIVAGARCALKIKHHLQ